LIEERRKNSGNRTTRIERYKKENYKAIDLLIMLRPKNKCVCREGERRIVKGF